MITGEQTERCKSIFLGSPGVGKTSIIQSFMYSQFNTTYETTVGIDFFKKEISVDGKPVSLQIWDTAGQEQFRALIPGYIRDAKVVVIVYDVSDPKTLEASKDWYQQVLEIQGSSPNVFLVGNKSDLTRIVTDTQVANVAKNKMIPLETSAKTGEGITLLFNKMAESVATMPLLHVENAVHLVPTEPKRDPESGCPC